MLSSFSFITNNTVKYVQALVIPKMTIHKILSIRFQNVSILTNLIICNFSVIYSISAHCTVFVLGPID